MKPFKSRIAGLVPRDAFKHRNLTTAAKLLENELARQLAAFKIIGADKAGYFAASFLESLRVDARIENHDRDTGPIGLHNGRDNLTRAAGSDAKRRDLALNEVFDDLHLLLNIHLAFGC